MNCNIKFRRTWNFIIGKSQFPDFNFLGRVANFLAPRGRSTSDGYFYWLGIHLPARDAMAGDTWMMYMRRKITNA